MNTRKPNPNDKADVLASYYYDVIVSKIEHSSNDYIRTKKTIEYLFDNDFDIPDIIAELKKHRSNIIRGEDLSDSLWKDSLIKRGAFYLHRELRIVSPPPVFNLQKNIEITYPYFCEMKIRYTRQNLLDYFYNRLKSINRQLVDKKTDLKAIDFLMNKYSSLDYIEPLDVILCSIDNHLEQRDDTYRLIDITKTNLNIINQLMNEMMELESKDLRKIVWR